MLPLGDSPRTHLTPWINWLLIGLNVLAFGYEVSLGEQLGPFIERWGVVPAQISRALAGAGDITVLFTLFTAMFLHASLLHLGGNLLFLWIFGDNIEDRLGHAVYLTFYLTGGVIANLAQVLVAPASPIPAVGASGAIAAVLGAYAITYPGARVTVILPILLLFTVVEVPALIMIGIWFATQFFSGVSSLGELDASSGGVAWWAHIGGFIGGAILMAVLPKRPVGPLGSWPTSLRQRARTDTGLIGALIGTISMISQLIQFGIVVRLIVVFFGAFWLPFARDLVAYTNPLLVPFALVVPGLRLGGHPLELYALVAVAFYYFLGTALIWAVASLTYGRRYATRM